MGQGMQYAPRLLALCRLRMRHTKPKLVRVQDPFGSLLAKAKGSVLISIREVTTAAKENIL